MKRKVVLIALCCVMLVSAAFAGGTKEAAPAATSNKLVVAVQSSSLVSDYNDNYFTNYLEEKLGIEIEFYMLPSAAEDVRTNVSLLATSLSGLPDILITDNALTPETILSYGSTGVFEDLTPYIRDAERMPNYNAIPASDREAMETAQLQADGKMYSLSKYEPETWNLTPNRTFINKAWLDKLGLEMPTTTDELEQVLIAFRDGDPNGNGIKDEVGVYGYQAGGYGQNIIASLMNSFEFWNGGTINGGLALSEDGSTVIAPFVQDGWKQGLEYMNRLYREGVLSPAIFTDSDTQYRAVLNGSTNVVGLTSSGSLSSWTSAATNPNFLEMKLIAPVTGPEGKAYSPFVDYSPNQEIFIFAGCSNIDLALKLIDEFYDPYTSIVSRFGEEGVDWTIDPEFLEGRSNAYVAAGLYPEVTLAYISNYWYETSNKTWHGVSPRYASLETMNTVGNGMVDYNPNDPTQLNADSYEFYYNAHPAYTLPVLHYTVSEVESIQEALLNIPDYVEQATAEFITGARDLDRDWNTYISQLESMGLSQWLAASQAAYDRSRQ